MKLYNIIILGYVLLLNYSLEVNAQKIINSKLMKTNFLDTLTTLDKESKLFIEKLATTLKISEEATYKAFVEQKYNRLTRVQGKSIYSINFSKRKLISAVESLISEEKKVNIKNQKILLSILIIQILIILKELNFMAILILSKLK